MRFDVVADRIRLHRQSDAGLLLIVEGEDDEKTLETVLPDVTIFPAGGRQPALENAKKLRSWGFRKYACVIDLDFGEVTDDSETDSRIVPYDGADLEGMLISLGVLETVVIHQGSREKINECGGARNIVASICRAVVPISNLRHINAVSQLGVNFDGVDLATKVDKSTLILNVPGLCQALVRATDNDGLGVKELVDVAQGPELCPGRFRGKDAMAIAGIALRRKIGVLPHAASSSEVLSASLRSSAAHYLASSAWLHELRRVLTE